MKKFLCSLIFSFSLVLTGCSFNQKNGSDSNSGDSNKVTNKLNCPSLINYDESTKTFDWSPVEHATKYGLKINSKEDILVDDISYTLDNDFFSRDQYFYYSIRSIGDNSNYYDSDYSEPIRAHFIVDGNDNVTTKTKLQTPQVNRNGHIYTWSYINNATGYVCELTVDSHESTIVNLASNTYEFSYQTDCSYSIRFKATAGNSDIYADSDWTNKETHDYVVEHEALYDFKNKVLSNGIGHSINAIKGEYGTVIAGDYQSAFDRTKLYNIPIYYSTLATSEGTYAVSSSVKETLLELGGKIGVKVSTGGSLGGENDAVSFSKSLSVGFELSVNYKKTTKTKEIYGCSLINVDGQFVTIENRRSLEQFRNITTNEFKNDALLIKTREDAHNFLNKKYGTHVVTAGIFGGRAEFYYSYLFESEDVNWTIDQSLEVDFSNHFKALALQTNTGVNVSEEFHANIDNSSENSQEYFYSRFKGGSKPTVVTSQTGITSAITNWLSGFSSYDTLVDFPEDSLIPIWDLLPDSESYSEPKRLLKEECTKEMNDSFKVNMDIYNADYEHGEPSGDSIYDPYLIKTTSDFYNVFNDETKNAEGKYISLENDLDLHRSFISPISEMKATFLGNGHTLYNYSYYDGEQSSDTDYCALFLKNTGTINNLIMNSVDSTGQYHNDYNIGFTCNKNNDNHKYKYLGGIVGINEGFIYGCGVNYLYCSGTWNVKTYGTLGLYAGGIAGHNKGGTISKCYSKNSTLYLNSDVGVSDGKAYAVAGSIVGLAEGGKIEDCYSINNRIEARCAGGEYWTTARATADVFVGAIVGQMKNSAVLNRCIEFNNTIYTDIYHNEGHMIGDSIDIRKYEGAIVGFLTDNSTAKVMYKLNDLNHIGYADNGATSSRLFYFSSSNASFVMENVEMTNNGWLVDENGYPYFNVEY